MRIIKTGLCSYGMSGKLFHAPFIQNHPGFELTAIVERHLHESAERYPQARLLRSFEELIADDSIELIVVNTPVQTHYDYAKAALEAGKDVVLEKPATVTAKEIEELVAVAIRQQRLLSVYQNRRYDGDYLAVKNIVEGGLLGELKEVEMRYDRYRPGFSGKAHKEGNLPGAGTLHDLGAHLADQCIQLFGMPDALFADVRSLRDTGAANDYFELLLYYPGLRVRLKSTVIARETYHAYILHGMKGSFFQHRSDMQEQLLLEGVAPGMYNWCSPPTSPDGILHAEKNGEEFREETTSYAGNYMNYYEGVWQALTNNASNPVPAADAVKTMRLIDAALQSEREKKIIQL